MSLKNTDVRTPGDEAIAKKFKLSLARVRALVKQGAEHEKEHNTNWEKAEQVARDHIAERPDYYKMLKKAEKTKVSIKEESGTGGVRGLGYVSGDPAGTNYVQQYLDTNAMSYEDMNGNKLEWIKKKHKELHGKKTPFNTFDPTNIDNNKNFVNEGISAGPERDVTGYQVGDLGGGRTLMRPLDVKEGARLDKAKKAAMAGITAANIYTAGDVMSRAAEGRGGTKGDVVRMATTLPGAPGWAATGVHYAKKAYDKVKQMKEDKDPCWKGYEMVGMKKKGGRKVPNCVPVNETGQVMSRYTERPTYENKTTKGDVLPQVGGVARGIYETIKSSTSHKVVHRDSKKIIAQGTKKEMMKKMKALNAENPGSHFLGNAPSKKVGDVFSEGWASIGHAYDWAGDRNPKAKFYGNKPKATTTKGDEKDDTYEDSNKGKKVKFARTVKKEQIDEISHGLALKAMKKSEKRAHDEYETDQTYDRLSDYQTHDERAERLRRHMRKKFGNDKPGRGNTGGDRLKDRRMSDRLTHGKRAGMPSARHKNDLKSNIKYSLGQHPKANLPEAQIDELKAETLGSYVKKASASRKEALKGKPDIETWSKRQKGITTAIKKLTNEELMDTKDQIHEAIGNIMEENLHEMKDNFLAVLQEKAIEKLEERKKVIASEYFSQ